MRPVPVSREQVLRFRQRMQQLDRPHDAARATTDAAVLDLGVQDTGPDGALWALANRGVPVRAADPSAWEELVLAWTVGGAPHAYRRRDLDAVARAVRPFSEADAAKRVFDAATPLRRAGVPVGTALATTADAMHDLVRTPLGKGEVSSRLSGVLPAPYLRWCRPCGATHPYEMTFRLAALFAGLVLEPGTNPPVLTPVPGWSAAHREGLRGLGADPTGGAPRTASGDPEEAGSEDLDVVRAYLRFLGPADAAAVAGYLDAPPREVRARLDTARARGDVVDVEVEGRPALALAEAVETLVGTAVRDAVSAERTVRLLGPFDLHLQARDRELLVPDAARRRELWPTLGRPGAVLRDGEVVGVWRPRASGRRLRVQVQPWEPWDAATEAAVDEQAARLAAFRGLAHGGRA